MNEKRIRIFSVCLAAAISASIGFNAGYIAGKKSNKNINFTSEDIDRITNSVIEEYTKTYPKSQEQNENLDGSARRSISIEEMVEYAKQESERLHGQRTFNIENLIVIKKSNSQHEKIYILYQNPESLNVYNEYRDEFSSLYEPHNKNEECKICSTHIHFCKYESLINYLTKEEMEKAATNKGQITTTELDEILERINSEYKEVTEKNRNKRTLVNNS